MMDSLSKLGVVVVENFVSLSEEKDLIHLIEGHPGRDRVKLSAPNRMIRFGQLELTEGLKQDSKALEQGYKSGRRSYGEMNDGIDVAVRDIPWTLQNLSYKLIKLGLQDKPTPVFVINKYLPGCKISRHIDHDDNGPVIPVASIGSDAVMVLTKPTGERIDIEFKKNSLVVLSGESRYDWFHEILPVKELRYAIVFRNLPTRTLE